MENIIKFILALFFFFLIPVSVHAYEINYIISPGEQQSPGGRFILDLMVTHQGKECIKCNVYIKPIPNSQPMDEIMPVGEKLGIDGIISSSIDNFIVGGITDSNGSMKVNINSYQPGDRDYMLWVGSSKVASSSAYYVKLPYSDNAIAGVWATINRLRELKIKPPPMGNIHIKAMSQKLREDGRRAVVIKSSIPYGTKYLNVTYHESESVEYKNIPQILPNEEIKVVIPAFGDVDIYMRACSSESDISCVDSNTLTITKLPTSVEVDSEIEILDRGLGNLKEENFDKAVQKEKDEIEGNVFIKIFSVIYSIF